MQAVTFDSHPQRDTSTQPRAVAQPVVGASSASAQGGAATGAHVELAVTAVSLAAATSAPSEVQRGDAPTAPRSLSQGAGTRETNSPAANLALSAEAQRLALIPAQVMDAEEIEAARKVVAEAQTALADARAEKQAEVAEALTPAVEEKSETRTAEPKAEVPAPETASSSEARTAGERAEASPPGPRSPFESSSPGSTGQSLDIVVGEEAPRSHSPGSTTLE